MSCAAETFELPDITAGLVYEFSLGPFTDEKTGANLDITGRRYVLTVKRSVSLTDAQATGADGFQISVTADAEMSQASDVPVSVPATLTGPLSGVYVGDIVEILPTDLTKPRVIVPLHEVRAGYTAYRGA